MNELTNLATLNQLLAGFVQQPGVTKAIKEALSCDPHDYIVANRIMLSAMPEDTPGWTACKVMVDLAVALQAFRSEMLEITEAYALSTSR